MCGHRELADLQPKLEAKHKINKLRKLLDELAGITTGFTWIRRRR